MTADLDHGRARSAAATIYRDNVAADLNDLTRCGYQTFAPRGLAGAGYGWHLSLDMVGCDAALIDDPTALRLWVDGLVDAIGMRAYGEPRIEHFGHGDPVTSGYTVDQLIETSNIMGHLSPHRRTAHVDVFSCRPFSPMVATLYTERGLGGRGGVIVFQPRG